MKFCFLIFHLLLFSGPLYSAKFPLGTSFERVAPKEGEINQVFPVLNDQTEPLIIQHAQLNSSGCKVTYTESPILPKKRGGVALSCLVRNTKTFQKTVTLTTNQGTFTLKIFSESCPDVNMNEAGGSMENVQVRDQQSNGICYAETSAQLFDAYRFTHGDKDFSKQTSALEIAYLQATTDNKKSLDSGSTNYQKKMLQTLSDKGGCDQSYLEKKYPRQTNHYFWSTMQEIMDGFVPAPDSPGELCNPSLEDCVSKIQQCMDTYGVIPTVAPQDLPGIGQLLEKHNLVKILQSTAPLECESKFRHGKKMEIKTQIDYHGDISATISFIKEQMVDKKSLPISIHICQDLIESPKSIDPNCKINHAVLVTGMRRDPVTQSCQLLIRNSWGKKCYGDCDQKGSTWIDTLKIQQRSGILSLTLRAK